MSVLKLALSIAIVCTLATSQLLAASYPVTVLNNTDKTLWVTVSGKVVTLVEDSSGYSVSQSHSSNFSLSGGAKGASAAVGGGSSNSNSESGNTTKKYAVKNGPNAGSLKLPAGESHTFAVENDSAYYLTAHTDKVWIAGNVPFSVSKQSEIQIDSDGVFRTLRRKAVMHGASFKLKVGNLYVSRPVISKNWPSGVVSESATSHIIERVSGKGEVKNGNEVRIKSSVALPNNAGYVYMYSSDKGWIYYDRHASNDKQIWIINKVTTPGNTDNVIRSNDQVFFTNKNWTYARLRNYDNKSLSCENSTASSVFTVILDK